MRHFAKWGICFGLLVFKGLGLCAQQKPGGDPFVSAFEAAQFQQVQEGKIFDPLALFLANSPEIDAAQVEGHRLRLTQLLDAARLPQSGRPDAIFRGLRAQMLARYTAVADVEDVFSRGNFNCVSATALMALAYQSLGMEVELREQSKHVYLFVMENGQRFRIETTAEDFGAIRERGAAQYAVSGKQARTGTREHVIDLPQLAGLQYYNEGLAAMDADDPARAMDNFRKAELLYPSQRVQEMKTAAADACHQAGISALRAQEWTAALALLERAAPLRSDPSFENILAMTLLHQAEAAPSKAQAHQVLSSYAQWRPSLCSVQGYRDSYADACLLRALELFAQADQGLAAQALMDEFEALAAKFSVSPSPEIAAFAYHAAFLQAYRAQDFDRAQGCLQRGRLFAPQDARLLACEQTFAN